MSHIVVLITAENVERHVDSCDRLINQIDRSLESSSMLKSYVEELNKLKKEIKELKQEYLDSVNRREKRELVSINSKRLTLEKRLSSLEYTFDFTGEISKILEEQVKVVKENGAMAVVAIDELILNDEIVTKESILAKIEELRNKELEKNKLDKEKLRVENYIVKLPDVPEKFKKALLNKLDILKTPQEIDDFVGVSRHRVREYKDVSDNIKTMAKAMQNLNFGVTSSKLKFNDELKMISLVKFEKKDGSGHSVSV